MLPQWLAFALGGEPPAAPGPYETWASRLRAPWLTGSLGKGLAAVIGDLFLDWARAGTLEHLPTYASDPSSLALLASERQLEPGPSEAASDFARRLTYFKQQWQSAGTALGMLVQLYFEGFAGAVVVQQNGLAFQLSAAPDLADPAASLVVTPLAPRPVDGHPWWRFDNDDAWCSRFAVLFPPGAPDPGLGATTNLRRIQRLIALWKPAKATCVAIIDAHAAGPVWGWPVRKWGAGTKWGAAPPTIYSPT
jgi:hypothetical protein